MANLALHDDTPRWSAHGFGRWAVTAGFCVLMILCGLSGPFVGYLKNATAERGPRPA